MYRTDFGTLWEKAKVGCSERTALKQVYYQGWNRSPAQVGCMRQVLRACALGRPRGMGCGGRWEGRSGWGTHVNPWLIPVNVWQKPLQYHKVISLQLIKIHEKKKKRRIRLQGRRPQFDSGSGRSPGKGTGYPLPYSWASLVTPLVKNLPAMPETWVWSLGWKDPLEKGKAYLVQYSGLENSLDCIVHGVAKSWTQLSNFHSHFTWWYKNFEIFLQNSNNISTIGTQYQKYQSYPSTENT